MHIKCVSVTNFWKRFCGQQISAKEICQIFLKIWNFCLSEIPLMSMSLLQNGGSDLSRPKNPNPKTLNPKLLEIQSTKSKNIEDWSIWITFVTQKLIKTWTEPKDFFFYATSKEFEKSQTRKAFSHWLKSSLNPIPNLTHH